MSLGILLIVLSSILLALRTMLYRLSAQKLSWSQPFKVLIDKFFLTGLVFAVASFLLNIIAYRYGDLSLLQPLLRLTIIWQTIIAKFYFKEIVTPRTSFAIALILGGSLLVVADL